MVFPKAARVGNKFRSDNGQYLTEGLFYETMRVSRGVDTAIYTLKPYDHTATNGRTYPSLKKLYLAEEDIVEFDFANKYLEDYPHWEKLCDTNFFKIHIAQWRKELVLKLKTRSLKNIVKDASDGKYEANKFLITNGWVDKDENGKRIRGRPTKEEIKEELTKQAETQKELQEDLERLKGLN